MKTSLSWLKEFININMSVQELTDKLTMAGLEVEDIEYIDNKNDAVIELGITPNRSDCLSVVGIAREIYALTGNSLIMPEFKVNEGSAPIENFISITNRVSDICLRYTARLVTDVTIGPSPKWLLDKLKTADVKSINNVVDITNLVLMEFGHPLHAFDYNKIGGKEIIIRNAKEGEKFISLDKSEYTLTSDMLIIADNTKPVALAGVVGGAVSEVAKDTKNIILEAAYFDPLSIRKTSKKLGIHTESSHRFERGVDYNCIIKAIDRAAQLIQKLAGGNIAKGVLDIYPNPVKQHIISIRISRTNQILNTKLDEAMIKSFLSRVSIPSISSPSVDHNSKSIKHPDEIQVKVPSFRRDITREIDLIEEVARLYGYNNISSEIPLSKLIPFSKNENQIIENKIKDTLTVLGFYEVINYSFTNSSLFKEIGAISPEDKNIIYLKNPLTKDFDIMRTTLIPGLLQTISNNIKKGNIDNRIFETGKIFYSDIEEKMFSCAITASQIDRLWTKIGEKRSFYNVKSILETIMSIFKVNNYIMCDSEHFLFVKGCSADIVIDEKKLGVIGEINRKVLEHFQIQDKIFILELNLTKLANIPQTRTVCSPIPKYPSLTKDVAFIIDKHIKSQKIIDHINNKRPDLLKDIRLFDYYEGKSIPDGKKSLCYSLTYRSENKTLTEEEVNTIHDEIINRLKSELNVTFRD